MARNEGVSMIGRTLSHYSIVEKIGAGGMGEVYRAHDERLERDVALKVLPTGTLADEAARKRFRKEALALSKLNHPNIATVFDFDTQDGVDFLVMELVEGVTLSDKLAAGALSEREITRLGAQLAEGLTAAHEQRVVHRDLKPANLRVTPDRRLKILDFGLAKLLRPEVASATATTESFTETQGVAGTLPYMAPEQLRGEQVDARTDIHALGAVLYEMATGQRAFPETQTGRLMDASCTRHPSPPAGSTAGCRRGWRASSSKPWRRSRRTATNQPKSWRWTCGGWGLQALRQLFCRRAARRGGGGWCGRRELP